MEAEAGEPRDGVDLALPIGPYFEVEVGTGRETGGAHSGDLLPCLDLLAFGDVEVVHVAVNGDGTVVVLNSNPVSVTSGGAGIDNNAVGDSVDGGTSSIGNINAAVEGAPARAESGGDDADGG